MKEVIYKLKNPTDGVKELVLFAPTRKQLKFAAFVKSSFMSIAMEMAEKMPANKTSDKDDRGGKDDTVLSGHEMLAALYTGTKIDVGNIVERFQSACTDSPMCQMNGGPVPDQFWDNMQMEDAEGLLSEFLGNFITI